MAASKQASPGMIFAAVVVGLLILGGLWWKFLGPGSVTGPGNLQPPQTLPQPTGMPGGAPGPGGGPAPGAALPGPR